MKLKHSQYRLRSFNCFGWYKKKIIPSTKTDHHENLEADSSDTNVLLVLQDESSEAEHT